MHPYLRNCATASVVCLVLELMGSYYCGEFLLIGEGCLAPNRVNLLYLNNLTMHYPESEL
jgi:hypothetical protein